MLKIGQFEISQDILDCMLDSNKIKLGIAPIGWTNDDMPELGGDISFDQCIKEMEITEFSGTEIGSKFPKDIEFLKKKLNQHGLQIASQWFSAFLSDSSKRDDNIEQFKVHMLKLKDLGANVVVVSEQHKSIQGDMSIPLFDEKPQLDDKEWSLLCDGLEKIGKIAVENGMSIVYHHHMGTVVQTLSEVDKLMKDTNPDYVSLLADTGHMYYSDGPGSALQLIKKFGDRIKHIHLKDIREPVKNRVRNERLSFLRGVLEGVFTVPGDGAINFDEIFEMIGEIDYHGWLIVEAEQDPAKANPLEYAKKAREFIRKHAGI